MDRTAWVSTELVPSLLAEGKLCSGSFTLLDCKVTHEKSGKDHFASTVYFVHVLLGNDGDVQELNLIVKMEPTEESHRMMMNTEGLFANEIVMYADIFPLLRNYIKKNPRQICFALDDLFPVCYKAHADPEGDSFLVLENLKSASFSLSDDIFIDYERCRAALQQIGRFHGLSYAYKKQNPAEFFAAVGKLTDPRYKENSAERNEAMRGSAYRGLPYAKSRVSEGSMNLLSAFENQLTDSITLMREYMRPKEPLAVLCHGDFCRNNVFFRPSVLRAAPYEMKMFDLQLSCYASPAIDLAFFAYMSTSPQLRKDQWGSLFEYYHKTVVETLAQVLGVKTTDLGPEFSLQSFKEDFANHAFYAYMLCSFFLPVMMTSEEPVDMAEIASQSQEVMMQNLIELGGEKMNELVGELLKEIVELKLAWVPTSSAG